MNTCISSEQADTEFQPSINRARISELQYQSVSFVKAKQKSSLYNK